MTFDVFRTFWNWIPGSYTYIHAPPAGQPAEEAPDARVLEEPAHDAEDGQVQLGPSETVCRNREMGKLHARAFFSRHSERGFSCYAFLGPAVRFLRCVSIDFGDKLRNSCNYYGFYAF